MILISYKLVQPDPNGNMKELIVELGTFVGYANRATTIRERQSKLLSLLPLLDEGVAKVL
ncbi:hypothetical protein MYX78_01410 [Acidobacteria bacterium AH-259-G07]|nr:hypothetical protein [Acidobacteria bacterium AH-259-G07]